MAKLINFFVNLLKPRADAPFPLPEETSKDSKDTASIIPITKHSMQAKTKRATVGPDIDLPKRDSVFHRENRLAKEASLAGPLTLPEILKLIKETDEEYDKHTGIENDHSTIYQTKHPKSLWISTHASFKKRNPRFGALAVWENKVAVITGRTSSQGSITGFTISKEKGQNPKVVTKEETGKDFLGFITVWGD